jgi:CheY-like chemotaxis protein
MEGQTTSHNCVLIVEDDPDIREITKLYLRMAGRKALTAENGQEAIELLEKGEKPCLILLDLMMPVMDGWTFAEALSHNAKFNDIPIIVATAFADDADTVKNARIILKKPVSIGQLKSLVEKYCP